MALTSSLLGCLCVLKTLTDQTKIVLIWFYFRFFYGCGMMINYSVHRFDVNTLSGKTRERTVYLREEGFIRMGYFSTWCWRIVKFALTIIVGHFKHHFSLPEGYKVELHFFSKYSNGRLYMLRFLDRCETISSNHSENVFFFLMFQVLHRMSWKLLDRTWCLHGDWQTLFSLFLMWCTRTFPGISQWAIIYMTRKKCSE